MEAPWAVVSHVCDFEKDGPGKKQNQDPEPGKSKLLFKEFLSEIPWEAALGDKGVEQSQLLFKEEF